jgi:WD40 repeat protein
MRLIPGAPETMTLGLALSPDGKTIATTRSDGRLSLRNERGTECILDSRGGVWWGLAFSPDGRYLAVGRDEPGIAAFDLVEGGPGFILDLPLSQSRSLAFSPDGRTLAVTSGNAGRILLWDLAMGRERSRLTGRFPAVDIAFSPDGRTLAVAEQEQKQVILWDLKTGLSRSLFTESAAGFSSVAFSPDGSLLAAAGPAQGVVRLCDVGSGRVRLEIAKHAGGTNAVGFSPDGSRLVTSGSDGMVRIWRVDTGEPIARLDGDSPQLPRLLISDDGRILAAGRDNHIRVWHVDDIAEIRPGGTGFRKSRRSIRSLTLKTPTPSEGRGLAGSACSQFCIPNSKGSVLQ